MTDIIIDKGENILLATIRRSVTGLTIKAKSSAIVEEYFREQSRGLQPIDVSNWDRYWIPQKDYPALHVLPIADEMSPLVRVLSAGDGHYTLNRPGSSLFIEDGRRAIGDELNSILNLSWIRLAGISQDAGVAFSIKGVFTKKQVDEVSARTNQAMKRFFLEFLRPVNVTIIMTTQEASHV